MTAGAGTKRLARMFLRQTAPTLREESMRTSRHLVATFALALSLAAGVAHAQSSGSGGGSSGGASGGGASTGAGAASTPGYSARSQALPAGSGGVSGHGAGSADAPRLPETAGRTIRCPDGSIGKTDAGGCLGDPQRR